jgi:hypothetical protein
MIRVAGLYLGYLAWTRSLSSFYKAEADDRQSPVGVPGSEAEMPWSVKTGA